MKHTSSIKHRFPRSNSADRATALRHIGEEGGRHTSVIGDEKSILISLRETGEMSGAEYFFSLKQPAQA